MSGVDSVHRGIRRAESTIEVAAISRTGERFESGQALATVRAEVRDCLPRNASPLNFTQRRRHRHHDLCFVNARAQRNSCPATSAPARLRTAPVSSIRAKPLPDCVRSRKYAVVCGGGHNHRYGLSDAV